MWRYRLRWLLIIVGSLLTGFFAWYESEHQPHTVGYSSWIAVGALVGLGLIDLLTKIQETSHTKGRLSGQTFLEEYTGLLTNAIEALQDVHTYNEQQLHQTQTKILKLIASVVTLFHPEVEGLGINANLMQNEPVESHSVQDKFQEHVHFSDPHRGASFYESVLCVKAWADLPQTTPSNFALPVDKDKARVLFGAPLTFVSGQKIVIANIHNRKEVNKRLDGHPPVVRDAIHDFFKHQKYKTFMSIVVENADTRIAGLNVQADRLHVFGSQNRQAEMEKFIAPFCSILGIITAQSLPSSSAPEPQ